MLSNNKHPKPTALTGNEEELGTSSAKPKSDFQKQCQAAFEAHVLVYREMLEHEERGRRAREKLARLKAEDARKQGK